MYIYSVYEIFEILYLYMYISYENERRGPDHQCGPIQLRGPIDFGGPKVPLLFFYNFEKKKSKTSLE